ncbi:lariat debranching enzyme [Ischnura elegans]|uniref:lariat debranching enzyme n=1 Tax=Ischnura elegans TaxID=197161 RepID=UPI001ED8B3BD|nr:lariat debranching enzyme [Ischnura elegans]XP_046397254.1 lariat debranching enzyme [Ischnura elegans]
MKIAVEGCAHGELEKIYESIDHLQKKEGIQVDLLICCGDFQSTRNLQDLKCMAVPLKYQEMCTFYKYYSGEKTAPMLTIFVGGNHEASNYLQELPYGGWVAPNIYYMGYAGVINIAGVRIAGISGIYKGKDYYKGHYEKPPYSEESKRSAYHIRNVEVFRVRQMQQPIDVFLSHDWPTGVYKYGDTARLLQRKPFFTDEVITNRLGSGPYEELLKFLKPSFWFAAHLHVKFAAVVPHPEENGGPATKLTKFLALDKCLPRRQFLQIVEIPHDETKSISLEYDLEWLTILSLTNHLTSVKKCANYMPGKGHDSRWNFTPTDEEKNDVLLRMESNLAIPKNFAQTVPPYNPETDGSPLESNVCQPKPQVNPQTTEFCRRLGIDDPMALLLATMNEGSDDGFGTPRHQRGSWNDQSNYLDSSNELSFCSVNEDEDLNTDDQKPTGGTVGRSLSFSPPTLGRLSLPTPRNDETSTCEEEGSFATTNSSVDISDTTLMKVFNVDEKEVEPDGNQEETAHDAEETKPLGPKKFKRRNESLYAEPEEDLP